MSSDAPHDKRFLEKIKAFVQRLIMNTAIAFVVLGICAWLIRFFWDQLELLLSGINWFVENTNPLFAFVCLLVLGLIAVYLLGNYSLAKLGAFLFAPSKNRKVFFTIKMESPLNRKGYCHGYVTRIERRGEETFYTAWIIFGGFSPVTDLKEGDFIRTDLTMLQILSMYLSGDTE